MWSANEYASAYDRHKKLINDYLLLRGESISSIKRDASRDKTDYDVIKENHKFLWDESKDQADTWGAQLAKKYYDKLFKEYCICDLTFYKYNKVALRWRTEKEVVVGKGQFACGDKKCDETKDLRSWEVNFGYAEDGEKKNALVKLRLCPACSDKLNHGSRKRQVKRNKAPKRLGGRVASSTPGDVSVSVSSDDRVRVKVQVESEAEDIGENKRGDGGGGGGGSIDEIWKEAPKESGEKSREEEFEEYLADLLL